MPELTEREFRICTRMRWSPWSGAFSMGLSATMFVLSQTGVLHPIHLPLWWIMNGSFFVAGFVFFLWAAKRELERELVMEELGRRRGLPAYPAPKPAPFSLPELYPYPQATAGRPEMTREAVGGKPQGEGTQGAGEDQGKQ